MLSAVLSGPALCLARTVRRGALLSSFTPAEPLEYSLLSAVTRPSGFFYQCYLLPLALAVLMLNLDGKRPSSSPARIAVHTLVSCLLAAGLYFLAAPHCANFRAIGTASEFILLTLICLYALLFSPIKPHVRVVVTAAVITNINWAQSISTQVFMPHLSLPLSNVLQLGLLLLSLAVVFVFRPSPTEHVPTAYWLSMLLIAVLSTACLYAVRVLNGRDLDHIDDPALGLTLVSFFVVSLLIYYLYYVLVKEHRRASEMAAMQARMAQDREFYARMDAVCREYQGLRHELKNHFAVMQSLLDEKRYDRLHAYFEDFAGKSALQLQEFHCANPLIGTVITRQINTAKAANVQLDVIAAVPAHIGIDDDDLCSLLSNMIDNGVEGCLRAGGHLVRAALHTEKDCLFITVTNPAGGDVLEENPGLQTTKQNPSAHGFGIPIIRRIAEKYDGIASFHADNGWFTADAMLYMEES